MDSDETQIEQLLGQALAPYSDRPDAEGVARLTADLVASGQALHARLSAIPPGRRTERGRAALAEWSYFVDAGPTGRGDHASWNHARTLARILRNMLTTVGQQPSACGNCLTS
ncbi:hypothetical protein ACFV6G_10805 [Streptomyces lavendulae]|uniref:hypothetical protein n=1 Tax=Streptomyces lavendulae TaxID=1914 RepID=UPI0036A17A57